MVLYANMGDRAKMNKMYGIMVDPATAPRAGQAGRGRLPRGGLRLRAVEPGGGRHGRQPAEPHPGEGALTRTTSEQGTAGAGQVRARGGVPHREDEAGDGRPGVPHWFKTTIAGWENFKSHPSPPRQPDGKRRAPRRPTPPYVDYGGEADFTLARRAGHGEVRLRHRPPPDDGPVVDVDQGRRQGVGDAEKKVGAAARERGHQKYGSFEWAPAAFARRARSSTRSARASTSSCQVLHRRSSRRSSQDAEDRRPAERGRSAAQADQVQDHRRDQGRRAQQWRSKKDQYLEVCDQKMVGKYVTAALVARKYSVKDTTVRRRVARLAYFTDYIGDDKMKQYVRTRPTPRRRAQARLHAGPVPAEALGRRRHAARRGQPAPLPASP